MEVVTNGQSTPLDEGATLVDLLDSLGLGAKWVVAEVNGEAVERAAMPSTELHQGDRVELVRAVAGG